LCDLETSRMGAPYIYDISSLRVNMFLERYSVFLCAQWANRRKALYTGLPLQLTIRLRFLVEVRLQLTCVVIP